MYMPMYFPSVLTRTFSLMKDCQRAHKCKQQLRVSGKDGFVMTETLHAPVSPLLSQVDTYSHCVGSHNLPTIINP